MKKINKLCSAVFSLALCVIFTDVIAKSEKNLPDFSIIHSNLFDITETVFYLNGSVTRTELVRFSDLHDRSISYCNNNLYFETPETKSIWVLNYEGHKRKILKNASTPICLEKLSTLAFISEKYLNTLDIFNSPSLKRSEKAWIDGQDLIRIDEGQIHGVIGGNKLFFSLWDSHKKKQSHHFYNPRKQYLSTLKQDLYHCHATDSNHFFCLDIDKSLLYMKDFQGNTINTIEVPNNSFSFIGKIPARDVVILLTDQAIELRFFVVSVPDGKLLRQYKVEGTMILNNRELLSSPFSIRPYTKLH